MQLRSAALSRTSGTSFPRVTSNSFSSNGGTPEVNRFDIPAFNTASGINLFYGALGHAKNGDLLYEQRLLKRRLPAGVIAIADAEGGNRLCISLLGEDRDSIYFWDHELESEHDTAAALAKVANSFDAFLELIQPFDPKKVKLEPHQVKRVWINPEFLKKLKSGTADQRTGPSEDRS